MTYFQNFLVATVLDVCETGNTIVPGEQTAESPTDYTLPYTNAADVLATDAVVLEIDLATPSDSASSLTTDGFCGPISTYVIVKDDEGTEVTDTPWLFYSPINSKIFIEASDETYRGSYTIILNYVLDDHDAISLEESLMTLNIVKECADANSIVWSANYNVSPQTYIRYVTDPVIVTLLNVYDAVALAQEEHSWEYCFTLDYELSYTFTDSDGEITSTTGAWPLSVSFDAS